MLKNVTVRNSAGQIIGTYETFSAKESEQREALRRAFGPGRYKISYHRNGPKNTWVFVGANGITEQATSITAFQGMPATDRVDLTIYRELILPLANQISAKLDELKSMIADLSVEDTAELSGIPAESGQNQSVQEPAVRISEALERLKNGEKIESLIADYADLIPAEYAGIAPMLLGMLNKQQVE
jgi:hypothetical protein